MLGGKEIDLYLLYTLVTAQGGWIKVCKLENFSFFIINETIVLRVYVNGLDVINSIISNGQ